MTDKESALCFLPNLYMDEREPFPLAGVGYSVLKKNSQSPSFDRSINLPEGIAFCIEYALYFDYDIQHLYDLEHIFVYVDKKGQIQNVEASFHGFILNSLINALPILHNTHPCLYCQPGKHALMPDPSYFNLLPDLFSACTENAGKDGFLNAWTLNGAFKSSRQIDETVQKHIKEKYSFLPSMRFSLVTTNETLLMPYEQLQKVMIFRLANELRKLGFCNFSKENIYG